MKFKEIYTRLYLLVDMTVTFNKTLRINGEEMAIIKLAIIPLLLSAAFTFAETLNQPIKSVDNIQSLNLIEQDGLLFSADGDEYELYGDYKYIVGDNPEEIVKSCSEAKLSLDNSTMVALPENSWLTQGCSLKKEGQIALKKP